MIDIPATGEGTEFVSRRVALEIRSRLTVVTENLVEALVDGQERRLQLVLGVRVCGALCQLVVLIFVVVRVPSCRAVLLVNLKVLRWSVTDQFHLTLLERGQTRVQSVSRQTNERTRDSRKRRG